MRFGILIFFCLSWLSAYGQKCHLSLSGYISDKSTGIPLEYATVFVEEAGKGVVTDSTGFFRISGLCPAAYHLRISHLGCAPENRYIGLLRDSTIRILLSHHTELLSEVLVHENAAQNRTEVSSTVDKVAISEAAHKNISEILSNISGVSILRNGAGISKPVIHGMYGNRISILNNGILQSGQQWGNDHAPEIDPFVADHLSVIKGAASLAYGGNSLGGVVLVEPAEIADDPHLHGSAHYAFQSNGLGHTANTTLEQSASWAAWRIGGTIKLHGDSRSPDYYLTNTGKREANLAIQLEKQFRDKWQSQLYYSLFNTEIGILRGSHISNLTDLESAIGRDIPFFTSENFSYKINAPRQRVTHHLLKLETSYFMDQNKVLKMKYGAQLNQREEYDIRRGDRSDIPALSLLQYSHHLDAVLDMQLRSNLLLSSGIQSSLTDNTNDPETGILPLIPDYRAYNFAGFSIAKYEMERWAVELGTRLDFNAINAVTISSTLPRRIERFSPEFFNYAFSAGLKFKGNGQFSSGINLGYLQRSPEVNELYSAGLHQGVSGIEEGNKNLNAERSLKFVFSNDLQIKDRLFLQALAYFQHIGQYIYLQPQSEFRLSIRGAFPVFVYQQTDANLYGMDWLLKFESGKRWKYIAKYALIRGRDLSNNLAIINIPADNVSGTLTYLFENINNFTNSFISVEGAYVFRQNAITSEQDFAAAPDAYYLLGLKVGTTLQFSQRSLKILFKAENLLNHSYRDYLNRLRYFADETGINLSCSLHYTF